LGTPKEPCESNQPCPYPQCAEAVMRNIRQSAIRSGRSKLSSAWTPNQPVDRRTANEIRRIQSGITPGPPLNPIFYREVDPGSSNCPRRINAGCLSRMPINNRLHANCLRDGANTCIPSCREEVHGSDLGYLVHRSSTWTNRNGPSTQLGIQEPQAQKPGSRR
jgi:hypothetical protein